MQIIFRPFVRPLLTALMPLGWAFLPMLGMAGISALGNWLGGRSQSKMHDASIAANDAVDRRRSQDWRHYAALQQAQNQQFFDRQQQALNALGGAGIAGLEGIPLGALALGGGAQMAPRSGGGQMISQTPQLQGGGIMGGDTMDLLTLALMSGGMGTGGGTGGSAAGARGAITSPPSPTMGMGSWLPVPVPLGGASA